jgi:hypothetical protein
VQSALPIVVFGAVLFSVVMSIGFLIARGNLYDDIGDGGLLSEHDFPSEGLTGHLGMQASSAERELEVRQMVTARSERRVGRGEPPLDIEDEVSRLLAEMAPAQEHDAGLAEEVRQLVVARNERRQRQGLEPLEVDAEVARTLAELSA